MSQDTKTYQAQLRAHGARFRQTSDSRVLEARRAAYLTKIRDRQNGACPCGQELAPNKLRCAPCLERVACRFRVLRGGATDGGTDDQTKTS